MSESDVHRRQILTYKDCPRAEKVKRKKNCAIYIYLCRILYFLAFFMYLINIKHLVFVSPCMTDV